MELKIIGTGSSGNAYLLENEKETLIIEVGVRFSEIKKALDFNLSKVVGAIQSHYHGDHSKGTKEALTAGIDVYMSETDKQALGITHHRAKTIEPHRKFKVGDFTVLPFDVKHDVPCLGFLINHKDCGNTLFITDTFFCPYTFKDLNNIIMEVNYCNEIIKEKLTDKEFLKGRILMSHMSLENALGFLKANDLKAVNNIVLTHLSDSNSNEELFRETVKEATGKTVTVASKKMNIQLTKTPF